MKENVDKELLMDAAQDALHVGHRVKAVFPNVDRWTVISRDDKDIIREMVKAMAVMECQYRISDEEFDEAWELV